MKTDRDIKPPAPAPRGPFAHPVFALGFRPFFLLTGLLAVLWLPLWLLVYTGVLAPPIGTAGVIWHAHEMVFGFAGAVVAGFLLTAVKNWTRQAVPTGAALAGLVALWILGRLAVLFAADLPTVLVAAVDAAFLPAVALAIAIPIWRAKSLRNAGMPMIVLALGALNAASYADGGAYAYSLARAGVHVLVLLLVLMGGRVIPFFTRNALETARVRTWRWLDWTAFGTTAAWVVADFAALYDVAPVLALAAGAANLARLLGWDPLATRRTPLLWVLHLGYLWIGVGLALTGLGAWSPALGQAAFHALTVGALGTLIVGMITRVSLGHTGRALVAPRPIVCTYALITLAALTRVFVPLLVDADAYRAVLTVAGTLWSLAFAIFFVVYLPILTRPRPDGRPG